VRIAAAASILMNHILTAVPGSDPDLGRGASGEETGQARSEARDAARRR
jgi:hypothetical protein